MNGERLTDRPGGLEKRTWILAAVICAVLLGVSAVMFITVKSKMNETLPAVMLSRESGETLAVVEIGAGFNTPGVIRWPGEQVTRALPNARLIRVNRDHPDVPDDLADRAWAIAADARTVIEQLTHPSGASS